MPSGTSAAALPIASPPCACPGASLTVPTTDSSRHACLLKAHLQYHTLSAITDDIDDARVYGGLHFRYDQDEGRVQGTDLGRYIYKEKLGSVKACNPE